MKPEQISGSFFVYMCTLPNVSGTSLIYMAPAPNVRLNNLDQHYVSDAILHASKLAGYIFALFGYMSISEQHH